MHPILFEFPGLTLYTQTVLVIAAFTAGLMMAVHESRRAEIPQFELINVILVGFIGSIVGARLFFLLLNWNTVHFTIQELCTLGQSEGGFAFHGGLVFGGLTGWLVSRHYRLSVWRMGDVLAPGLALAMFFLRLGCLMNGCDFGVPTTLPWAIMLHGSPRHPIQLYEGFGSLALLPVLLLLNRRACKSGTTLLWYICLSSVLRFGVDIFRDDPFRYRHLTIPQCFALGLAVTAGLLLRYRARPARSIQQKNQIS